MTDLTKEQLETELARAYRALRGFYGCLAKGEAPTPAMHAYHGLTLAAAARFVQDDALDGTEYFIGKPVEVLHEALAEYTK